jgi:hypothetical protein
VIGREGLEYAARKLASRAGAGSAADALRLGKQLASEAGVAELRAGGGQAMAGAGAKKPIDDIARLVSQYGGVPGSWSKVTSGTHKFIDGVTVEVHAYRNVITHELVELKSKVGLWKP